jgi:hypothetical protein
MEKNLSVDGAMRYGKGFSNPQGGGENKYSIGQNGVKSQTLTIGCA